LDQLDEMVGRIPRCTKGSEHFGMPGNGPQGKDFRDEGG
jgi:hypothetical protein